MSKNVVAMTTTADDERLIAVLQNSLYPGANGESVRMVLNYCRASGLDVMQKPVHIVPMWDNKLKQMRDVVMPGIGLYRTQAARTGEHAGTSDPEFGPDVSETVGGQQITYPAWCRVVVRRQLKSGLIAEYPAKEFWRENYAVKGGEQKSIAPNAMWTRRTYGQLAKCAEAQALRKGFPEVGAAPTAEEMEGKAIDPNVVEGDFREIPDPWTEEARSTAAEAAAKGLTAYTEFWKAQTDAFRESVIKTAQHANFKQQAAMVDQKAGANDDDPSK